ncbi:MAG: TIGR02281 family clan AA aspartic protease [Hyphomicrobiales bacterium]
MLVDVLKFAARPLAMAVVLILLAVKGSELLHRAPPPAAAPGTAAVAARPAPNPVPSPASGGGPVILEGNRAGQFQAEVDVEGATLRMLVDTGASAVSLTAEDAEHAGLHPFPSDFTVKVSTANGIAMAARVELREVSVGPIRVRDVQALVMQRGALSVSLLGMTFLQRLSSFQVSDNRLVLKP